MPRLKIAEVFFFLDLGGVERSLVLLANALADRFEVHAILLFRAGMMAKQLRPEVTLTVVDQERRLEDLVRRLRGFDVVHVHSNNQNPVLKLATQFAGVDTIIETVHTECESLQQSYVDHTICVSEHIRQLQHRPAKSSVIYNGLLLSPIPERRKAGSSAGHNPPMVLEVRRADKEMDFELSQFDTLLQSLGAAGRVLGVDGKDGDAVRFKGRVQNPEHHYQEADILFHFPKHEGLGNVVLEALRWNIVPLTAAIGGIPEVVTGPDCARIVEHPTQETVGAALAALVRAVKRDDQQLNDLRSAGQQRLAERFDLETTAAAHITLYERLTHQPRSRHRPLTELLKGCAAAAAFLSVVETFCFRGQQAATAIDEILRGDALPAAARGLMLSLQGQLEIERGDTGAALASLQEAVGLYPGDAELHAALGALEHDDGDLKAAARSLNTAFAIDPHNLDTALRLIAVLVESDNGGAAVRIARAVIDLLPEGDMRRMELQRAMVGAR